MSKKKRPLILGSYITHLAINLYVLDLSNHDLHVAYQMEPLDIFCLEKWAWFERVTTGGRLFPQDRFASPLGHLLPALPLMAVILARLPPPILGTDDWHQLQMQVERLETRVTNIDANVHNMAQNLTAFMHLAGLAPQFLLTRHCFDDFKEVPLPFYLILMLGYHIETNV